VLSIDGRSGSGKTTLALQVAERVGAVVIHLDDLYDGWTGLNAGIELVVHDVLRPAQDADTIEVPRYDWALGRYAAQRTLHVDQYLIVEGVGAGALAVQPFVSALVFLDAPADVRRQRAFTRADEDLAEHWDEWAALEDAYLQEHRPRERADFVYEETGAAADSGSP